MRIDLVGFVAAVMVSFVSSSAVPAAADTSVEVVESYPIETTLAVPGVRSTQEVWLDLIHSATKSIDIEQMYVNNEAGQSLEPVLNALATAAARGVKVRFLLDAGFLKTYPNEPQVLSAVPGIAVETVDFSSYGGIMHAKYMVVDGANSYVGSANFDWLALTHIHELGLHVSDAGMGKTLETIFARDWAAGRSVTAQSTVSSPLPGTDLDDCCPTIEDACARVGNGNLKVVASPPAANPSGQASTLDAIAALIAGAKRSVRVQVYEYDTSGHWKVLDDALRAAAKRGAKVQIAVDAVSLKSGKKDLEALAQVPNVEVKVITIPQWSGGPLQYARLIHSKYMIVDGQTAWVGSENWIKSYFTGTRNVGFVVTVPDVVSAIGQIYDKVWTSAYSSAP